jgi:uncharacterized protein (DUF1697 family)
MSKLKDCLGSMGLEEVKTFLQTGNVTFQSVKPVDKLKQEIQESLQSKFNYTAFVLIFPVNILNDIIEEYPFERRDGWHRYAIFCENKSVIGELIKHRSDIDTSTEDIAEGKNAIYWNVPQGNTLQTYFSKLISKPKYKSTTTNRNLNTLEKMVF